METQDVRFHQRYQRKLTSSGCPTYGRINNEQVRLLSFALSMNALIGVAIVLMSPYYVCMNRDEAISRIKSVEPAIRALGASALYLFGSTARNEAKPTSDVDVFVDRATPNALGFIEFFDLEDLLREALGTKVDLATRASLHPTLRPEIEQSAIRVL